ARPCGRGPAELALRVHDRMVSLATERADPNLISDALLWRSVAFRHAGSLAQARQDLDRAAAYCAQIASPQLRSRTDADIKSAIGAVASPADPTRALAALDSAIEYFGRSGDRSRLPAVYLSRGRLHASLHEDVIALQDLNSGIREIESQRGQIPRELRISYFETARALFDDAIRLLARAGRVEEAFNYAERARARSLLDDIQDLTVASANRKQNALRALEIMPPTGSEVRKGLPGGVRLVQYVVLEKEVLIWVLGRDGISLTLKDISRARRENVVSSLRTGIQRQSTTAWWV